MPFNWKLSSIITVMGQKKDRVTALQISDEIPEFKFNSVVNYLNQNMLYKYVNKIPREIHHGAYYELTQMGWELYNKLNKEVVA